jgi:hypothetical protein
LLKPENIIAFSKVLRSKLLDRESKFGKDYLKVLVKGIRVDGKEAEIIGSYAALAGVIMETKNSTLFCIELAPRPGLEPGTHGLTLGPTAGL